MSDKEWTAKSNYNRLSYTWKIWKVSQCFLIWLVVVLSNLNWKLYCPYLKSFVLSQMKLFQIEQYISFLFPIDYISWKWWSLGTFSSTFYHLHCLLQNFHFCLANLKPPQFLLESNSCCPNPLPGKRFRAI